MADIKRTRKCRNYISTFVAIYKTGEALENLTEQGLHSVHNHVKQTVGNVRPCVNQCSKNLRYTNRWCFTCTSWRDELEKFISRRCHCKWQGTQSCSWPNSPKEIAEVFVVPDCRNRHLNLKDISTIFNVWNRCLQFQRQLVNLLEPLKESRNELVHNTANMKLTNAKKKVIFQQIDNVVNNPDIKRTIPNHTDFLQALRELKKGRLFEDDIKDSLQAIGMHNAEIKAKLDEFSLTLENTHTTLALQNRKLKKIQNTYFISSCIFTSCIVMIFSVLYGLNQTYSTQQYSSISIQLPQQPLNAIYNSKMGMNISSQTGCLRERSDIIPHITLRKYIDHHHNFVGRKWLTRLIERKLFDINERSKGVVIEAGMGYGKSAYLKHIICSNENSSGSSLRNRLVAFHVCRFDVLISKQMNTLVIRLLNLMSSQMPFINNAIKSCIDIFGTDMCKKDPYGCLDQCLLIPLNDFTYKEIKPVIIILDGLDECFDSSTGVNEILNLLTSRLHKFPTWVKFLVSSRPDQRLHQLSEDLQIITLKEDSRDNVNDIYTYIKVNFPFQNEDMNISNFLLLSLFKQDNRSEIYNARESFPMSLYGIYQLEFQRLFAVNSIKVFNDLKPILEVISSSFEPPSRNKVWYVLSNVTNIKLKEFNRNLQLLDNFFRYIENKIHLFHLSFHNWLLDENNVDFSIDIEIGHELNALYLFERLEYGDYDLDIVDLALHVDLSLSEALHQRFLKIPKFSLIKLEHRKEEYPLFRLARRRDSRKATYLLMQHFQDIETRNKENLTVLYVAASLGHLHTFNALVHKGANIGFRTNSFSKVINFENAAVVSFEHQHWDYGVMDIAAQNGHVNVIKYLLEKNNHSFYYPIAKYNSMNLLPIHLSCKKGHTANVKAFHIKHKWMLDWQCLYYASEIGRSCLVKYILDNKIKDGCPKCEPYINWIEESQLRVQGKFFHSNILDDRNISNVLNDDWAKITCESALHVAVKEKKLDVVKILTRQTNHAIFCYDRGGRTPVVSAIHYGFREIVEHFRSSKFLTGNESCAEIRPLNDSFKLHENEIARLGMQFCENRMPIPHILAKYNHFSISEMLTSKGIILNWLSKDSDGCFPIHKAACHDSVEMLEYLLEEKDIQGEYLECTNGSTPLHSAVGCRSVKTTEVLLKKFQKYDSDSKDIMFSFVKLAMKTNYGTELAKHYEDIETGVSQIISLLVTNGLNFTATDNMGRNILHYAIYQGHFKVVYYLLNYHQEKSKVLIKAKDSYKRTPLLHALFTLKPLSHFFLPEHLFHNFSFQCKDIDLYRMTPKEYALLLTINYMKKSQMLLISQDLFRQFVKKQCVHIVKFFLDTNGHIMFGETSTLSNIIKYDNHGIQTLAYFLVYMNKLIASKLHGSTLPLLISCTNCNELKDKCHTHKMALNYLKVSSLVKLIRFERLIEIMHTWFFHKSLSHLMNNCYDIDGFNVFERAVQGGSPELVRYLSDTGVKSALDKVKLIEMALNGLKYRHEDDYIPDLTFTDLTIFKLSYYRYEAVLQPSNSNDDQDLRILLLLTNLKMMKEDLNALLSMKRMIIDELVSHLIKRFRNEIHRQDICLKLCKRFSLIHRLAFEGLTQSIGLVVKLWGNNILNCKNIDDFTPLYLSMVFKSGETTKFIIAQGISFRAPSKSAESYFYYKLVLSSSFTRQEERNILCVMMFPRTVPYSTRKRIKAYNCAKKALHIITCKALRKTINAYKWKISNRVKINTWRSLILRFLKIYGFDSIFSDDSYLYARALVKVKTHLEYYQTNSKLVDKSDVDDNTLANLIEIADAEKRTCNYLRVSTKKVALIFKDEAIQYNNCISKDVFLRELNVILENLAKYRWGTNNCSDVASDIYLKRRELIDSLILVTQTFQHLRIKILNEAVNRANYVPFSAQRANFSEIIQNPDTWFRFYHQYHYMNEFQGSLIFKESFAYKSKGIYNYTRYIERMRGKLKLFEWRSNADKLLEQYITSKGKL